MYLTVLSFYDRVRVVEGKIYPPGEDKWEENCIYYVTYPKGNLI